MARLFNGTSDNLSAALTLSSFSQLSIALWLYWDSYADDFDIAFEYTTDVGGTNGSFAYLPNNSGGVGVIYCRGTVGYTAKELSRPSAAAWHHYVFEFDLGVAGAGAIVAAYVDGVSQTIMTLNSASQAGTFANSTLHFMSRATSSLFGAGRIAEVGIYGGALLNADEVNPLSKGFSPLMVRPGNLEAYWPLIGRYSPELDLCGLGNATVVGAVASEHVRVIYPSGPMMTEAPAPSFSEVERSATIGATASISTTGSFFTTVERSLTVSASANTSTSAMRELNRAIALDGAALVTTASQFFTVFQSATAIDATPGIAVSGLPLRERAAAISAIGIIQANARFFTVFEKTVAIDCAASISVAGGVATVTEFERSVLFGAAASITVSGGIFNPNENRTMTVNQAKRTFEVKSADRTFVVPKSNRTFNVE